MPREYTEKQAIEHIQKYLNSISKDDENMISPPIDGVYEADTRSAVKQFQYKCGLKETGVVDKKTHDLIFQEYCNKCAKNEKPMKMPIFPLYPIGYEIKLDDQSFLVSCVQYILGELSYYYNEFDEIKITSIYSRETMDAIKSFQSKNQLEITGNVNKDTWNKLVMQYDNYFKYTNIK